MKFQHFLFVGLFLLIFSMSAISAADLNESGCQNLNVCHEIPISKELDTNFESNLNVNINPGTFDDLQVEINNANAGSVLDLSRDYNGHYGSRIQFNKDLVIDGHGHTLDCLGEGGCSAFYSNCGNIVLKNLKIINAHNDYTKDGGAIRITGSAQYLIENCTFESNWAKNNGGAIFNEVNKPLTIKDCTFLYNSVDASGAAIFSKGELFIYNSNFERGSAKDNGGAIYCENNIVLSNVYSSINKAVIDGGVIFALKNVNVDQCSFLVNNAEGAKSHQCRGGAIFTKGDVNIDDSLFYYNNADDYGGAIYAEGNVNINVNKPNKKSVFEKNHAHDNDGGAIYTKGKINIFNAEFCNNSAILSGGAVYALDNVNVNHCVFDSNRGAYAPVSSCNGGAIYSGKAVAVDNCSFVNNIAENYGGAIYAIDVYINLDQHNEIKDSNSFFINNRVLNDNGGAIYTKGNLRVANTDFIGNSAYVDGGAIFCENDANVEHCLFRSNKATGASITCFGGAIRSKQLTVDASKFEKNFADNDGGAIYADSMTFVNTPSYFIGNSIAKGSGGAIYVKKFTNNIIKHITFSENSAYSDGGAVYISGENTLSFEDCTFIKNKCFDEGGAIYLDSMNSHLTLTNNVFRDNKANTNGDSVFNCGYYDKIERNEWSEIPSSININ